MSVFVCACLCCCLLVFTHLTYKLSACAMFHIIMTQKNTRCRSIHSYSSVKINEAIYFLEKGASVTVVPQVFGDSKKNGFHMMKYGKYTIVIFNHGHMNDIH